jgi:hypothetical protein
LLTPSTINHIFRSQILCDQRVSSSPLAGDFNQARCSVVSRSAPFPTVFADRRRGGGFAAATCSAIVLRELRELRTDAAGDELRTDAVDAAGDELSTGAADAAGDELEADAADAAGDELEVAMAFAAASGNY